jgi:hypothetical protein
MTGYGASRPGIESYRQTTAFASLQDEKNRIRREVMPSTRPQGIHE